MFTTDSKCTLEDYKKKSAVLRENSRSISILTLLPTSLHPKTSLNVNDYRTKQTKGQGHLLTAPSPIGNQSKPNSLLTYELFIFVYFILRRKDMIGTGMIAQNPFFHL
jgi:hypothetical protein